MSLLPQRLTLTDQTAGIIRDQIKAGVWKHWLPCERKLAEQFQVGRNTLRRALRQLAEENCVQPVHGVGNRITRIARRGRVARSQDVGLLSPESLVNLPPNQTLWIGELRRMLGERGCRLHLFHGRQYLRAKPDLALRQLVTQHRHGCWILILSNAAIQRWFEKHDVRCVIAGSVAAGIQLPSRDHDQRAVCRHAAGMLLGLGHRRLALIITRSELAGDLESAAGFVEGVQVSRHPEATAEVCWHDGTVPGICNAMRRLYARDDPPTGLLVANAFHHLTVMGMLNQLGRRIPREVSVISRDGEAYMDYEVPVPTRYEAKPQQFARSLLEVVNANLLGLHVSRPYLRVMPRFVRGETIAAPRPGSP